VVHVQTPPPLPFGLHWHPPWSHSWKQIVDPAGPHGSPTFVNVSQTALASFAASTGGGPLSAASLLPLDGHPHKKTRSQACRMGTA
jgi:hypothetical protein